MDLIANIDPLYQPFRAIFQRSYNLSAYYWFLSTEIETQLRKSIQILLSCVLLLSMQTPIMAAVPYASKPNPKSAGNYKDIPICNVLSQTEIGTDLLSVEAIEVARHLNVLSQLKQLEQLRRQENAEPGISAERRESIRDIKEGIRDVIEQTRLEIDYCRAELFAEEAIHDELLTAYTQSRDSDVYKSNIWSIRTNGALWAIAEAFAIPTYKQPMYAIPSGITGILAGLVPTVFSSIALHQSKGSIIEREDRPNMLSKIFDFPVEPRIDFPKSVWDYIHAVPANSPSGQTRINLLIRQWKEDKNIRHFAIRNPQRELSALTGHGHQHLSMDDLADRSDMLTELDALIGLMHRPLLELMMAIRGLKHLPEDVN